MNETPIIRACREIGSQAALARLLGVTPAYVNQLCKGRFDKIPAKYCPTIERATAGAVRCEDLRPDVEWSVVRGTASVAA